MTLPASCDYAGYTLKLGLRSVGRGWHSLVQEMFDLQDRRQDFKIIQIKEKFGGLRIYTSGGDREVWALAQEIEDRSEKICEACGADGTLERPNGYWVKCVCPSCLKKIEDNPRDYRKIFGHED